MSKRAPGILGKWVTTLLGVKTDARRAGQRQTLEAHSGDCDGIVHRRRDWGLKRNRRCLFCVIELLVVLVITRHHKAVMTPYSGRIFPLSLPELFALTRTIKSVVKPLHLENNMVRNLKKI